MGNDQLNKILTQSESEVVNLLTNQYCQLCGTYKRSLYPMRYKRKPIHEGQFVCNGCIVSHGRFESDIPCIKVIDFIQLVVIETMPFHQWKRDFDTDYVWTYNPIRRNFNLFTRSEVCSLNRLIKSRDWDELGARCLHHFNTRNLLLIPCDPMIMKEVAFYMDTWINI